VLLRMVEAGVTPDEVSWSTLMSGYRTGEERNGVLLRMVEAGVTPDVSWNTLMSGYRTGEERNGVLLRMVEAGVTPNEVNWNTLMQGFAHDGLSFQCLACFYRMEYAHASPDSFTFSTLFTCLVRDGSVSAIRTVVHIAARRDPTS
jgi:hypothetical protein